MLFFGILPLLLAPVFAQKDVLNSCSRETANICSPKASNVTALVGTSCTAAYGGFKKTNIQTSTNLEIKLQAFANANIHESFHLLLLSSYFGDYRRSRDGFKKLYRQYSDKLWEDAIDVMKYIAKRGGAMDFKQPSHSSHSTATELEEIKSLALVMDIQNELAVEAFEIHSEATHKASYDPAIAHYIEERFLENYTDRIRDLSGYMTELKGLSHCQKDCDDVPLSVFIFDEYLQKSL